MAHPQVISGDEERWCSVGKGLNTLNRLVNEYIPSPLNTLLSHLPRVLDSTDVFFDCLCDSSGKILQFLPENDPNGIKLNFRALPHFEATVQQRSYEHEQKCPVICDPQHKLHCKKVCQCCKTCKLLKEKNQAIPIKDNHEMAHIFLQEFYKKQPCGIGGLDASANLLILSKPYCFSGAIQKQAAKVRETVRNKWAHAITQDWKVGKKEEAFDEMEALAKLLPDNEDVLKELSDRKKEVQTPGDYVACMRMSQNMLPILKHSQELQEKVSAENMLATQVSKMGVIQKKNGDTAIVLKESKVITWDEESDITTAYDILKENIEKYGETIIEGFNVVAEKEKKLKTFFKKVKLAGKIATHVEIATVEENRSSSLNLVIAAHVQHDEKLTVAHATHKLIVQGEATEVLTREEIEENSSLFKIRFLEKLVEGGIVDKVNIID